MRPFVEANPEYGLDADKPLPTQYQAYATDGSGANVNVIASGAGGLDLAALQAGYADQLRPLKPTAVGVERVQIAAGEALRGTYKAVIKRADGPLATDTVQFILVRDDRLYVATITQVGSKVSAKLADVIGGTFYLI